MVYMMDEMVIKPGMLKQYIEAYNREYAPGAKARGLKLVGSWIAPPLELQGESNTFVVLWAMDGVEGFWNQRKGAQTPAVRAWWEKAEAWQVSRTRRFLEPTAASPMK